jgi:glycosyltransferase involved in cell wall biosynthesis
VSTGEAQELSISIIIPARNEEHYLESCLRAVQAQQRAIHEMIVVDNGSTDGTARIATALGARVVSEPVRGLPRAREAGRRAASGALLVYLDADMIIPPDYLTTLAAFFRAHPMVLAASTPFRYYDGNWLTNSIIAAQFAIYKTLHVLQITRFIFGGSFAVRRETLAQIGGFNTAIEFYGEDTDLSKRLAKCGPVAFLDGVRSQTSARRYAQQGVLKTCLLYLWHYLLILLCDTAS